MTIHSLLPISSAGLALFVPQAHTSESVSMVSAWQFVEEYVLGTRLDVQVVAPALKIATDAASAVRAEIDRLNRILNSEDPSSDLYRLNRKARLAVAPDLFRVVQLSETWRQISGGAYDARIGRVLDLWRDIRSAQANIASVIDAATREAIHLEGRLNVLHRPQGVKFALDGLAKGYIVDAALNFARATVPGVEGLGVSIGGDMRVWGKSPGSNGWRIGIPDASHPAANAPIAEHVQLVDQAIATSGRGPRDRRVCMEEASSTRYISNTISPFTGQPVADIVSASVVASHTADADALATACMVLSPTQSLRLIDSVEGAAARIVDVDKRVHTSSRWSVLRVADAKPVNKSIAKAAKPPDVASWPRDWMVSLNYTAPPKEESKRDADFRTPYMSLWISDMDDKPIRTLIMVGTQMKWQHDNFIWYSLNRERAENLMELRSESTTLSGHYPMFWNGVDDDWKRVPLGTYKLHLETSQEHGKHKHREIVLELGTTRFKTEIPNIPGSGGIEITYGHPDDGRFSD